MVTGQAEGYTGVVSPNINLVLLSQGQQSQLVPTCTHACVRTHTLINITIRIKHDKVNMLFYDEKCEKDLYHETRWIR